MLNRNDKIYIVTDSSFPVGFAGASRIQSYAKGFISNNYESLVLCIRKTESPDSILNKSAKGIYQGVNYKYLSKSNIKSRLLIIRRIDNYLMIFRLFLYGLFKIKKNSAIIFYSSLTFAAFLIRIASLIKGFKVIKEENEHPSIRAKLKSKVEGYVFNKIHYKLFDGIIVITHKLYDYFISLNEKIPILHVPMIVDLDRFNVKVQKEKLITYSGMLSNKKDGIDNLIKSFAEISKEFPEYKLYLIGIAYTKKEQLQHEKLIDNLKIREKVIFSGRVKNDEIPLQISRSSVLVLPRPDSLQAQNGFPTKLGEYLATGIPVVVTSVGEIPDYLTDGKDAFIAVPGDIASLSGKLKDSLENPERSIKIGIEGKRTAEKYFDNKKQAKRIISFINEL